MFVKVKQKEQHIFEVGEQAIVFNAKEWLHKGDVGNNRQFFQK